MKMAKASERDIDAAGELMSLLNDISSGYYPVRTGDPEDTPNYFDEDDPEHLRMFYNRVSALLDKAPGFHGRVIGGMCYVILFGKNEIVDPEADTLELHPKLAAALKDSEKVAQLQQRIAELESERVEIVRKTLEAAIAASDTVSLAGADDCITAIRAIDPQSILGGE